MLLETSTWACVSVPGFTVPGVDSLSVTYLKYSVVHGLGGDDA